MNQYFRLLILCSVGSSTNLMAAGWPVDLVPTVESLGLHGSPRTIEVSLGSLVEENPIEKLEFYQSGILRSRDRKYSNYSDRIKVDKNGSVVEVRRMSDPSGSKSHPGTETYTLLKIDAEKRPTAIKRELVDQDQITRRAWATGVRIIKYGHTGELYEEYSKEGDKFVGPLRSTTERDFNGRVVAFCYASSEDFKCTKDSTDITEFGQHGIARSTLGNVEVIYQYENNVLALMTRRESRTSQEAVSVAVETKKYSQYVFDECGNWTTRMIETPDGVETESRKFTYYTTCSK